MLKTGTAVALQSNDGALARHLAEYGVTRHRATRLRRLSQRNPRPEAGRGRRRIARIGSAEQRRHTVVFRKVSAISMGAISSARSLAAGLSRPRAGVSARTC